MDYNEKIRNYIERAFSGLPDEEQVKQTKDELYSDLLEKYQTLITEGASPMNAYHATIGSIGDIFELVDSVGADIKSPDQSGNSKAPSNPPVPAMGLINNFSLGITFVLFVFYLIETLGNSGPRSMLRYGPFAFIVIALCMLCWAGVKHSEICMKLSKPDGFPGWYGLCAGAVWIICGVLALICSEKAHLRPVSWLILITAFAANSLLYLLLVQKNDRRNHN